MKNNKPSKEWHSANQKFGMGDFYGTAIKQKVGRVREDYMGTTPIKPKGIKTPPKSLA